MQFPGSVNRFEGNCHRVKTATRTTVRNAMDCLTWISVRILLYAVITTSLWADFGSTEGSDWIQNCSCCHCHWNSGKKTADCKNKQITAIPNDMSNELQVIDLSHNMIAELKRNEFMEANLQNLHKIFLKNCTIQELSRDAFKNLTILIELDLSHNFIRELHVGTFSELTKLRNLVMNNNQIEQLDNYLFANLPFLSRVEFKNNRLKHVDVHVFGDLPLLSAVYLESNQLTVLKKETFLYTKKLMHLSLAANPWNCTCELQEFRDFALANRLYTPPTDCNEPQYLHGKLWSEIPSENFACKPQILGSVRSFVEAQSDNITLPCRIEGSPRPNVTWLYNKRPLSNNGGRFHILNSVEQYRAETANILNSELRIFGVRSADKGVYSCIAENRGGRTEAEFQLLVNGDYYSALDGSGDSKHSVGSTLGSSGMMGTSGEVGGLGNDKTQNIQTNILLVICLVIISLLLLLIVVVLVVCWYCRRIRTYQKDSTMLSENGLISSKMDKSHNSSMLEGSVILEMQKSLLNEVNPVEKPPRRTELEHLDGVCGVNDDGPEIKKTLLDEQQFGECWRKGLISD